MEKRSRIVTLMICVLTLCLLGGCGKPTAKGLLEESQKNGEKVKSYTGNMNMDMSLSFAQSGVSMKIDVGADMDMEVTQDIIHGKGKLDIGILGLSMDVELFAQVEDEEITLYAKAADEWSKIVIPKGEINTDDLKEEIMKVNNSFYDDMDEKKIALKKDTEKYNEKDVYVITAEIDGDMMKKLMDKAKDAAEKADASEIAEVYDDLDFSKVKIELESKIYKEEKLPAAINMNWTEGINELFASAMGEASSEVEIKADKFAVSISYDEFDSIDKIEIPQEALDAEEAGQEDIANSLLDDIEGGDLLGEGGTDTADIPGDMEGGEDTGDLADPADTAAEVPEADADGYYTLVYGDGEQQVKVRAPEGLELDDYSADDYMSFSHYGDDISKSVTFTLEEAEESNISYNENYFEEQKEYYEESEDIQNFKVAEKKEIKAGDGEVEYVSCSYSISEFPYAEAQAWMEMDNGYMVECSISIAANDKDGLPDLEEIIKDAFEDVKGEAA